MSTESITSRLRSANPVPAPPTIDDPALFQRIVAIPRDEHRGVSATGYHHRRRSVALAIGTGIAAAAIAALAFAFFPASSQTSTGLSKFSTQGTPVSFAGSQPAGLATPYVLAQLDGRAYFRVQQVGLTAMDKATGNNPHLEHGPRYCYGDGNLAAGKLTVLLMDCTPFPSPKRPVLLAQVGIDATSRNAATLLSVDGFAADGVARLELVDPTGDVLTQAPVDRNVFHFQGVSGRAANGELVAYNHDGVEVWHQSL
jgi:hypothetical protein